MAKVQIEDKEIRKHIKEIKPTMLKNHVDFVVAYVKNGGNATAAYMETHPGMGYNSASTLSSKILKKLELTDVLSFMGINQDSMKEAMNKLLEKNPAEYMKYYCKLNRLDDTKIELSGEIKMPVINIITSIDEE